MAGYGHMSRGNFNTFKAMERHMGGNGYHDSTSIRPYAHSYPPAGENFSQKDNGEHFSNDNEQDLFEKVRTQMIQMGRRKNWGVKPTNGKNVHQSNGEYDHKANSGQDGKYNFSVAQAGAQRLRFGAPVMSPQGKENNNSENVEAGKSAPATQRKHKG